MSRRKKINQFQDDMCACLLAEVRDKLVKDGVTIQEFAVLAGASYADVTDALNSGQMNRPTLPKIIRWARAAGLKVSVVAIPGVEIPDSRDLQSEILRCWRALGRPGTLGEIDDFLCVPSNVVALRRAGFRPRRCDDGS